MSTETLMAWEGKMYVSASSSITAPSEMTEAENVDEIKITVGSYGEVEHHLQKHGGKKAFLKGYEDDSFSFVVSKEFVTSDGGMELAPDVKIIMNGIRSRKPIRILLADTEGGEGPVGDFLLFGGEMSLSGEEAQRISVNAKPYAGSGPIQWQKNGTIV
ncbi:MAG: hypothetical protein Q4D38_13955 [Planctomycetia bacterium]|nr:hypothetical protein [Planctomycetia bacterium]